MFGTEDIILILIVALLLFGPNKLPEFARSLGKATSEFRKAQTQGVSELKEIAKPLDSSDEKIHSLAVDMGLNVQDKSDGQLIEEIRLKIRAKELMKT